MAIEQLSVYRQVIGAILGSTEAISTQRPAAPLTDIGLYRDPMQATLIKSPTVLAAGSSTYTVSVYSADIKAVHIWDGSQWQLQADWSIQDGILQLADIADGPVLLQPFAGLLLHAKPGDVEIVVPVWLSLDSATYDYLDVVITSLNLRTNGPGMLTFALAPTEPFSSSLAIANSGIVYVKVLSNDSLEQAIQVQANVLIKE